MQTPSTLRRSGRLAPPEVSSPQPAQHPGRKRPQEDTPNLNPMAPNKKPRPMPTRKAPPKSKANQQRSPLATNPPISGTEQHGFGQQASTMTPHHPDHFVAWPPPSLNFGSSQGPSINTPSHPSDRLLEHSTNQSLIPRAYPSPVSTNNSQPGLATTRPLPAPVNSVDPSGFSHLANSSGYPHFAHPAYSPHLAHPAHSVHNSHPHLPHPSPHHATQSLQYPQHTTPQRIDLPPPAPDHVPSLMHTKPVMPTDLTQQPTVSNNSGAKLPPRQEDRVGVTDVIDVDEHDEENSSPSDGEDEEDPDDVIEVPVASHASSKGGVKFSPVVIDVLEQHWKKNGRPILSVGERPKQARPDPSPDSRRFYDGNWADVLDLATSLLLSKVLLEYAFPTSADLEQDSTECLMEAEATVRMKPSVNLNNAFLQEHRASMVKLVSKQAALYRGQLRDHVRVLVSNEVTNAIKDAPPVKYFDHLGRLWEVPEDNETIIREFIDKKLTGSRFLDGLWEKLFGGRDIENSLNSPLLRAAVIKIYDHNLSQEALRVSPSEEELDRLPIVPGDPGYHAHWSKVPPPRLVALAATILQSCYEEWRSGTFSSINLRGSDYFMEYDALFDLIYSEWSHRDRRDAVRKRFASWARASSMKLQNTA